MNSENKITYYTKNKAKINEYNRQYYLKNKKLINEKKKAKYNDNKDYYKNYYMEYRDHLLTKQNEYDKLNRDKKKLYYETNKALIKQKRDIKKLQKKLEDSPHPLL